MRPCLDGGRVSFEHPRSSDVHARYIHPPCPAGSPASLRRGRGCSVPTARARCPRECPRPRTDCRCCRKSHRCRGEYFHVAEGRGDAQQHHAADAERRSAIGRAVPRLLQPAGSAGRQSEPRARSAAREFAGFRFRDRFLRHRGHQQPRDRRGRRDHGDLQRRIQAQGRAHRQGSEDRHRVAARQAREAAQGGEVRRFGEAAARRVGGCHRQSVQPRRHRDGRHRVGPQPRHPVRPV